MARLEFFGFTELMNAFGRINNWPDSVKTEALTKMETIAGEEIRSSGERYGVRDPDSNVHILDNVKLNKPKMSQRGGFADVTFAGKRTRYGEDTRNAEIAFLNEYGANGVPARPFIGEAMNKNTDKICLAGADVLGEWLEKEFLG